MIWPYRLSLVVSCLSAALLIGCGEAPITREVHIVPNEIFQQELAERRENANRAAERQATAPRPTGPLMRGGAERMLAAILREPQTPRYWTVKLSGKTNDLAPILESLQTFLESWTWSSANSELPVWQLPAGWSVSPASDAFGRVATIKTAGDKPLELAVANFSIAGDWPELLLSNVNRWRGQQQLTPVTGDSLEANSIKLKLVAGEGLLLDLIAPVQSASEQTPGDKSTTTHPANEASPSRPSADFSATVPPEWKPADGPSTRLATYRVTNEADTAEIQLSRFPRNDTMADVTANTNRWRGEVGLAPLSATDAEKAAIAVDWGGNPAKRIDALGEARGTVAVMLVRDEAVWFAKLTGDPDLVKAESDRLIAYLKSFRFPTP